MVRPLGERYAAIMRGAVRKGNPENARGASPEGMAPLLVRGQARTVSDSTYGGP